MEYNFCPKCGGETNRKLPNLLVCKNCGYNFYINPASANAVIIENQRGEVLIVTRKFDPKKGYLDLPGGFVEVGESLEGSAMRELKEEIGITVDEIKYFGSYPDKYLFQEVWIITLVFILTAKVKDDIEIKASDDVSEAIFYPKDKIPLEKIAFEGARRGLVDYLKQQQIFSVSRPA